MSDRRAAEHSECEGGRIRVTHLIGGEIWAGAEVQVAHLLAGLARMPDLELAAILFADGRLAEQLRATGVTVSVLSDRPSNPLALVGDLARTLRSERAEILHAHGYKETILGAVAGRLAGVGAFVKTEHGLIEPAQGWARVKMSAYRSLDHWVTRLAIDRVIAVSLDLHRHLAAGLPAGRAVTIRNGLDPRLLTVTGGPDRTRRSLGVADDAPLLGTVGRLVPVKGLDYFLEMARGVLARHPTARFVVVGEGPLRAELERLAGQLQVSGAVLFTGFRQDVLDVVNALDVFVMPSLHEGLPMALLEAIALGKPIVASAVGGIPEVLDGHRGWLVAPRDVPALVAACLDALSSQRLTPAASAADRERLGDLARTMCAETAALYRALARTPPTAR